ncbi:hypothetical protein SAMN05444678_12051 [Sphingomonas sp. YR710]|uniref:hypothetical protein n=1 Tax=Sphingomonas sp. YR710 TaxID=1882773 RepID=UPI00088BE2C0|nr:hypothetical protein [Sphingomonas sp. YR710]SDD73063.1 hypothetical protein SAMN05444678_12051 [Sphingomonas sp. YR710]
MRRSRPEGEQGFVLITALWLLLLCGAVVALMMLRGAGKAEASHAAAVQVQARLDLDAAMQTIAADILFSGDQSQWARAPAQGTVDIDGRSISAEVSSEAGRLDLNDGDPAVIDRALQGLGVAAARRTLLQGRLQQLRNQNRRIASQAMLDHVLAGVAKSSDVCLDRYVTLYSGLTRPDEAAMPALLAQALAVPQGGGEAPTVLQPGTAIRVRLRTAQGSSLLAVIRVVGTLGRTYDVMRWTPGPKC